MRKLCSGFPSLFSLIYISYILSVHTDPPDSYSHIISPKKAASGIVKVLTFPQRAVKSMGQESLRHSFVNLY